MGSLLPGARSESALAQYHPPKLSAITHLFAGVPVSDLETSIDWYSRFFGRPPDSRVGDEVLWAIDEHAWLFIEPNAAKAGAGPHHACRRGARRAPRTHHCRRHRARTDRDLLERRPPREHPRSGRERDRVRRAARRRSAPRCQSLSEIDYDEGRTPDERLHAIAGRWETFGAVARRRLARRQCAHRPQRGRA